MTYDNEMRGVLFKNDKKGNEKAPDAKGTCTIDGVEYQVAAWTKTSSKGTKFQSLKFDRKDQSYAKKTKSSDPFDDMDDDIPF